MERRSFLKKAAVGGAAAAAVLAGCSKKEEAPKPVVAPEVMTGPEKHKWKMVTTWPPKLPVLQTGAERFAKRVGEMSGGRLTIDVYAGGELVPPLGAFDAVSQGTAECGSGASYYWAGKEPATQWFAAVPFGLNAQGLNAWFYSGGGLKLWEEVYAPFNLVPRPVGNTGVQMGGWFNREINSIADYKGLKMRIPGLGGKVISKAGGPVVLLAGGEIFTSLERGVLDATEWVGPMHDLRMGFYQAAKYYYYPGWHEPGTCLDVMFNKSKYDALSDDLKAILDAAAAENNMWSLCEFEAGNGAALTELVTKHNVQLRRFPAEVLTDLRKLAVETLEEEAGKSAIAGKVNDAFKKFQKQWGGWSDLADRSYFDVIAERYSKLM